MPHGFNISGAKSHLSKTWAPQHADAVLLIATTMEPAQLESALVPKRRVKPGSVLVHKLMLTVWLSLFPLVAAVSLEVLPEELS